ncbi:hypothetical protein ADUPG1_007742 [Aduncisulcus paluster]|uniref:Uncharacterized protein n=1 Tax=Aduncisulcus paluster TaxID=2918883 RepID=A0ABQ5KPI1_9EUKA|nr:hypothetical protein ADUPG1_007742 [Aduncisulcus paluster]
MPHSGKVIQPGKTTFISEFRRKLANSIAKCFVWHYDMSIHPSGRFIAISGASPNGYFGGGVYLLDLTNLEMLKPMKYFKSSPTCVSFSPSGLRLCVGFANGSICLIELDDAFTQRWWTIPDEDKPTHNEIIDGKEEDSKLEEMSPMPTPPHAPFTPRLPSDSTDPRKKSFIVRNTPRIGYATPRARIYPTHHSMSIRASSDTLLDDESRLPTPRPSLSSSFPLHSVFEIRWTDDVIFTVCIVGSETAHELDATQTAREVKQNSINRRNRINIRDLPFSDDRY